MKTQSFSSVVFHNAPKRSLEWCVRNVNISYLLRWMNNDNLSTFSALKKSKHPMQAVLKRLQ